jgi:hypothetical protein
LPAAVLLGNVAQRGDEIDLGDLSGGAIDLVRRLGAAERTDQLLFGRVPFGLRTTGRTRMLLER